MSVRPSEETGPGSVAPAEAQTLIRGVASALPAGPRLVGDAVIGHGGTAVVHRVYDQVLLRHTALKISTTEDADAFARFLAEAQIVAQLEHPHIVPVHEYTQAPDGRDAIQMKLVSGTTLGARVKELGEERLSPPILDGLVGVVGQVCDALAYAHSRGVVHRDVKPANVMLGEYGAVYLMDWGIALTAATRGSVESPVVISGERLPATGSGTPAFTAPEQIRNDPIDERVDVYGVGGLLYLILTGGPPHRGASLVEVVVAAARGRVTPPEELAPGAPRALCAIAMRALAPSPDDRFDGMVALREALDAFRRGAWHLPILRFAAGETILVEGDEGGDAYLVKRGVCRVSTASRGVVRELRDGEVFGELALVTQTRRTATVAAVTDVELLVVKREDLEARLRLDDWPGIFVHALAQRFAELEKTTDKRG